MGRGQMRNLETLKVGANAVNEFEYQKNQGELTEQLEHHLEQQDSRPGPTTEAERIEQIMADAHAKVEKRRRKSSRSVGKKTAAAQKSSVESSGKKSAAKKSPAKSTAKKSAARRAAPRKSATKKPSARRSASKKKSAVRKSAARKSGAKRS